MKVFGQILALLFGLALLGVLGVGGYFALKFIVELFASMDFQIAAVTGIASAVAFLTAVIIASSIRQASKQNQANQLRAEKAATYRRFIDVWVNLLQQGGLKDKSPTKLPDELKTLDRLLALYGSPTVIKAHTKLRALARESGSPDPNARSQFAKALVEIRKDLGSETHGLTAEELQQLLLPDSQKFNSSTESKGPQSSVALGPNS